MSLLSPIPACFTPQPGPLFNLPDASPLSDAMQTGMPVVLHHGLGFGTFRLGPWQHDYFRLIDFAIARQHPLIMPLVSPLSSISRRAQQLKNIVLRQMSERHLMGRKVIVIGHSLGGLDARYMITHLGMDEHVGALVTVATPHHSTTYADWCLRFLSKRIAGVQFGRLFGMDIGALPDLTTEACARFNELTPCVPGVRYYSVSACRSEQFFRALLMHAYKHVYEREGPNDGLVSVKSATWQQHLGTWNADHWQTINRRRLLDFSDRLDVSPEYVRVVERVERDLAAA